MSKYNIGDKVSSSRCEIQNAIVTSVERVMSNPISSTTYSSLDKWLSDQDTYQYTIAYEHDGQVNQDTLYEEYIDGHNGAIGEYESAIEQVRKGINDEW